MAPGLGLGLGLAAGRPLAAALGFGWVLGMGFAGAWALAAVGLLAVGAGLEARLGGVPRGLGGGVLDEEKTAGIDRDGSLKHTYDCNELNLVPLGHWNWKRNSGRSNYSVYERELLAGVLLLSSQTRLLADNPVVWLCDQASTSTFLKGLPPETPRLRRWWVFLSQLWLHIHHIRGLKNELSDYLSGTNVDERLQIKSEDLSKEAFQRMYTQVDLSLEKNELLSVINPKDYDEEYRDVSDKLGEAKYAIIEDVLWSVGSNGLLRNEIRTCVPPQHLNRIFFWLQDVEGHPESRSWLLAFNRFFYAREEDAKMFERISCLHETCEACLYAKRNRRKDSGLVGCLPLPDLVNSLVYVDFIDRQSYGQFDYFLLIVDSLSSFCHVLPCIKNFGGEQVLSLVHQHWIKHYGAILRLHSDGEIPFTSETGWWRNTFKAMGVEVTLGQPYSPQSNEFCERKNGEYRE